jgi:hypothetical protein
MLRRTVLGAAGALLLAAAPAHAQIPGAVPDYVSSDNVEKIGNVRTVGDGVGATIVGNYMYVTSTLSLSIFDITDAENPVQVGISTLDVEFENEEVPTNGKILGISGQIGCKDPSQMNGPDFGSDATGCLSLYDVSNPAAPRYIRSVAGAGEHTQACVLDCTWFYGSSGAIVDARKPEEAKVVGNWKTAFEEVLGGSCHHVREIRPGYILGSCQPLLLLSVLPQDGGSPEKPVLMATGNNTDERFQHSSRWPRNGADKFMLSGGETNAQPQCDDTVGAFMVWDASKVLAPVGFNKGSQFTMLSEVRPQNGSFVDGWSPVNGLGCSVHWFEEHPAFRDGGLVAVAEYENGTRLLQIEPNGKIVEQGYYLPLAGSASAPHWHPSGKVFYTIDYLRGFDIVRYTGETYTPDAPPGGGTPGTGGSGTGSEGAPCATAAGFSTVAANPVKRGLRFTVAKRQERTFDVDIFQQSSGRSIFKDRLRARFRGKADTFEWSGKDFRSRRSVSDGFYTVRFTMRLDGKVRDVRRLTLERRRGVFRTAPDSAQRTTCGLFKSFALSSSAFGGRSGRSLGISYRLARAAEGVSIVATVGKRVIRRFSGGGRADRTYRFTLPASKARRGQRVKISATVRTGSPVKPQVLYAKRL